MQLNASVVGTRIKHGTITLFGRGIEGPTTTSRTIVDRVNAVDNSAFGILLGPATVRRSIASATTGGTGIDIVGAGTGKGVIQDTVATDNFSDGIEMSQLDVGLVDRSTALRNKNRGIFMAADTGIVRRTTVAGSAGAGITLFGATKNVVDRAQAISNGGQGILFDTSAKAPFVIRSKALANGKLNFEEGILVNTPAEKATVISSVALGNFGDGIKVIATSAKVNHNIANSNGWGAPDGANFGINASTGTGRNEARGNDASDNQCVDDVLC